MEFKFTISHQHVLTAKQVTSLLGCVRLSVASRLREGILPLCSPLVGQFQMLGPVGVPQHEKVTDIVERFQQRDTEVMKGLAHRKD